MPVAVYLGCSENVLARQDLPSGATDDSYAHSETGAKTIRWGPADWLAPAMKNWWRTD